MKMANAEVTSGGTVESRRRVRLSSQSSEDKKPRGRPRVEPQDETAADRRRTQIRLAQRAYRLRKETTIASLKQRTTSLTSIINDMHAALSAFSDKATAADLASFNTRLAIDLLETQQAFVQLKERAVVICDDDAPDSPEKHPKAESDASIGSPSSDGQSPSKKLKRSAPQDPAIRMSKPTTVATAKRGVPSVLGYEFFDNGIEGSLQDKVDSQMTSMEESDQAIPDFWAELCDNMQAHGDKDMPIPRPNGDLAQAPGTMSIPESLMRSRPNGSIQSPASFAWQEASFARQLQRATLEAGVLLIQRRFLTPERFKKKFQMCLPFGDSDYILNKIKSTLFRDPSEPLDWNDHPMRHLGGAGTHYSRRSESGDNSPANVPIPASGALGPSELAELMNTAIESNCEGRALNMAGFEGEWFDATDVEGYLERKGIRFEPGSIFAMVEPSAGCAQGSKTSPSAASLDSLDFFSMNHGCTKRYSRKSSRDDCYSPREHIQEDVDMSDVLGYPTSVYLGAEGMAQTQSSPATKENKKVLIDVQKLVSELVKHATCIGRSPGYRRRDIDKAYKIALLVAN